MQLFKCVYASVCISMYICRCVGVYVCVNELSERLFIHRFVVAMVYYGVFLSAPTVGGDMYLNFFLSSLVELPAIYLGIKAYNRYVKHTRETW